MGWWEALAAVATSFLITWVASFTHFAPLGVRGWTRVILRGPAPLALSFATRTCAATLFFSQSFAEFDIQGLSTCPPSLKVFVHSTLIGLAMSSSAFVWQKFIGEHNKLCLTALRLTCDGVAREEADRLRDSLSAAQIATVFTHYRHTILEFFHRHPTCFGAHEAGWRTVASIDDKDTAMQALCLIYSMGPNRARRECEQVGAKGVAIPTQRLDHRRAVKNRLPDSADKLESILNRHLSRRQAKLNKAGLGQRARLRKADELILRFMRQEERATRRRKKSG